MEKLELVDAIRALREELAVSILASADEELRFEVGEIELTFQVAVERKATGGVKFWVIEVGGSAAATTTHSVRVPLTPKGGGGGAVMTGGGREIPETPPAGG